MKKLFSSEEDFWNAEKVLPLTPPEAPSKPEAIDRLEKRIETIRLAKSEEISMAEIRVRNRTKREVSEQLHAMEKQFAEYSKKLNEDFMDLRVVVTLKDREIRQLLKHGSQQEFLITEYRIHQMSVDPPPELPANFPELAHLAKENKALRIQIEALKEVCAEHKQEADSFREKCKKLQKAYADLQQEMEHKLRQKELDYTQIHDQLLRNIRETQQEFKDYKDNASAEFNTREAIQKRQQEMIDSLQGELKNAKVILQAPNLRHKVHERLQDYLNEQEEYRKYRSNSVHWAYPKRKKKRYKISHKTVVSDLSSQNCVLNSVIYNRKLSESPKPKVSAPIFHVTYRSPAVYTAETPHRKSKF